MRNRLPDGPIRYEKPAFPPPGSSAIVFVMEKAGEDEASKDRRGVSANQAQARRRRGRPKIKDNAPVTLVAELVRWRQARGLSQPAVAERLGLKLQTLQAYESGRRQPNGPNTLKILALLGCLPPAG